MFSSLSKFLSPKQYISSLLASSLADFFQVDPNRIETNLIQDAKVVLHEVPFRPRNFHPAFRLQDGSIQRIEFSWSWDAGAIITNVTLKVEGVKLTIVPVKSHGQQGTSSEDSVIVQDLPTFPRNNADESKNNNDRNNNNNNNAKEKKDWTEKYMQQILDHLTLVITDAEVIVDGIVCEEVDTPQSLYFMGTDIKVTTILATNQKQEGNDTKLWQAFSLQSLESWMMDGVTSERVQLVDPILGYQALVERIVGRRFLDGIGSGLLIQGEAAASTTSLSFHIAPKQMQVLGALYQLLQQAVSGDHELLSQCDNDRTNINNDMPNTSSVFASMFYLPIPSINLMFDAHDTTITLNDFTIHFSSDFSEIQIDWSGLGFVNQQEVVSTSSNMEWTFDLNNKTVSVGHDNDDKENGDSEKKENEKSECKVNSNDVTMNLTIDSLEGIYQGAIEAMHAWEDVVGTNQDDLSQKWKISLPGIVIANLVGGDGGVEEVKSSPWISAEIENFELIYPYSSDSQWGISFENIDFKTMRGGTMMIPKTSMVNHVVSVLGDEVEVDLASMALAQELYDFWNIIQKAIDDPRVNESSSGLPFKINVPSTLIHIYEPSIDVVLEDILGGSLSFNCGSWKASYDEGDIIAKGKDIALSLADNETNILFNQITKISMPGCFCLAEPLMDTKVTILTNNNGATSVSINCKAVNMQILPDSNVKTQISANGNDKANDNGDSLLLPFPVTLMIETLHAENKVNKQSFTCSSISVKAEPTKDTENMIAIESDIDKVDVNSDMSFDGSFSGIHLAVRCGSGDYEGETQESQLIIPSIGPIIAGACKIDEIVALNINGVGSLYRPLKNSSLILKDNRFLIQLGPVHLQIIPGQTTSLSDDVDSDYTTNNTLLAKYLSTPIEIQFERLLIMKEFGQGKPGLYLHTLKICVVHSNSMSSEIYKVHCSKIQYRAPDNSAVSMEKFCLDCERSGVPLEKGSLFGLRSANISIQTMPTFQIPKLAYASKPLQNIKIDYANGKAINIKADAISVAYHTSEIFSTFSSHGTSNKSNDLTLPCMVTIGIPQILFHPSQKETNITSPTVQIGDVNLSISPQKAAGDSATAHQVILQLASIQACNSTHAVMNMTNFQLDCLVNQKAQQADLFGVQKAKLSIEAVPILKISNLGCLTDPLQSIAVEYDGEIIAISSSSLYAQIASTKCNTSNSIAAKHHNSSPTPRTVFLPCPIRFSVPAVNLCVTGSNSLHQTIESNNLCVVISPHPTATSQVDVLQVKSESMATIRVCNSDKSEAKVSNVSFDVTLDLKNVDDTSLIRQFGIVKARLSIQQLKGLCYANFTTMTQPICDEVCCDDLIAGFSLVSNNRQGEFFVKCSAIKATGPEGFKAIIDCLDIDLGMQWNLPNYNWKAPQIPDFGYVFETTMKVGSIQSLSIPGVGSLSTELKQPLILFGESGLQAQLGYLEWDFDIKNTTSLSRPKTNKSLESDEWSVSFPLHISIETVSARSKQYLDIGLLMTGIDAQVHPPLPKNNTITPTSTRMTFISGTLNLQGANNLNASIDGIKVSAIASPNSFYMDRNPTIPLLNIPGVGIITDVECDINEVSSFNVPDVGLLSMPIVNPSIRFGNNGLIINCDSIAFIKSAVDKKPNQLMKAAKQPEQQPAIQLPCTVQLLLRHLVIKEIQGTGSLGELIICEQSKTILEPVLLSGMTVRFECDKVAYAQMTQAQNLSISAVINGNDLTQADKLVVTTKGAQICADFAGSSWADYLQPNNNNNNNPNNRLKLPFARVGRFDLTLKFRGKVLQIDDAVIHCDAFSGDQFTDAHALSSHYINIVKRRLPYLLSKTEVMGANLGDNMGMVAGRAVMKSSLIGSVVGISARDGIGGAISAGKASRGATASEKYQFGDFSRGVVQSAKAASKRGSQLRGDDNYQIGDFTTGSARAIGEYTSENKGRLGGAGGSSLGMIAGAALIGGPIGLIGGSILGHVAGKNAVEAVGSDKKKQDNQDNYYNQQQQDLYSPMAPPTNARQIPSQNTTAAATQGYTGTASHHMQQPHYNSNMVASPAQPIQRQQPPPSQQQQQHAIRNNNLYHQQQRQPLPPPTNPNRQQQGYRFGDMTRGAIARGKKADGRDENSGYKFGDFTRGLFK